MVVLAVERQSENVLGVLETESKVVKIVNDFVKRL